MDAYHVYIIGKKELKKVCDLVADTGLVDENMFYLS